MEQAYFQKDIIMSGWTVHSKMHLFIQPTFVEHLLETWPFIKCSLKKSYQGIGWVYHGDDSSKKERKRKRKREKEKRERGRGRKKEGRKGGRKEGRNEGGGMDKDNSITFMNEQYRVP